MLFLDIVLRELKDAFIKAYDGSVLVILITTDDIREQATAISKSHKLVSINLIFCFFFAEKI